MSNINERLDHARLIRAFDALNIKFPALMETVHKHWTNEVIDYIIKTEGTDGLKVLYMLKQYPVVTH